MVRSYVATIYVEENFNKMCFYCGKKNMETYMEHRVVCMHKKLSENQHSLYLLSKAALSKDKQPFIS